MFLPLLTRTTIYVLKTAHPLFSHIKFKTFGNTNITIPEITKLQKDELLVATNVINIYTVSRDMYGRQEI